MPDRVTATPEGTQDASHTDLVTRRSPAVPCRTSDTIVEIILEIPDPNTNIMQIGRVNDALQAKSATMIC